MTIAPKLELLYVRTSQNIVDFALFTEYFDIYSSIMYDPIKSGLITEDDLIAFYMYSTE